jgi:hypothetical protein
LFLPPILKKKLDKILIKCKSEECRKKIEELNLKGGTLIENNWNSIKLFSPQEFAKQNSDKEFLVSDYSESNLNGYTGQEMANMFKNAGVIPSNIVFNKNFQKLISTTPTTQPSISVGAKSLGSIKLSIIEDWVQSGQATTTVRNSSYHNSFYKGDGIYTTDKGNLVNITYKGLVKLQGNKVVGNNISYTKDEFAKAEGFGTWTNFQKNAKYAGKTLMDGGSVHLYNITTTQPSTSVESKKIKLKDGKNYNTIEITSAMLENIGYTPVEIGKILKKIC